MTFLARAASLCFFRPTSPAGLFLAERTRGLGKGKKDEDRRTGSGTGDDREGATGPAREQVGWATAGRVLDKVKCRPRVAGGLTEG